MKKRFASTQRRACWCTLSMQQKSRTRERLGRARHQRGKGILIREMWMSEVQREEGRKKEEVVTVCKCSPSAPFAADKIVQNLRSALSDGKSVSSNFSSEACSSDCKLLGLHQNSATTTRWMKVTQKNNHMPAAQILQSQLSKHAKHGMLHWETTSDIRKNLWYGLGVLLCMDL